MAFAAPSRREKEKGERERVAIKLDDVSFFHITHTRDVVIFLITR